MLIPAAEASRSVTEQKFVGFDRWADVVLWVDSNQKSPNPRWTYYLSPEMCAEGEPAKVKCKAIVRNVNGKADEQIQVSPHPLSNRQFAAFDANADHLGYFRREQSTSLLYLSRERGAKPFNIRNLGEPHEGPVHTCMNMKCKARYRALPFQSHHSCKDCRPPTHRCKHGTTNFERCPENKKDGPCGDGLTRIVYQK
jgi:hypothetical protein